MGGFGSGRRQTVFRDTADACPAIDINYMHRHGLITPGQVGELVWYNQNRKRTGSAKFQIQNEKLVVGYGYSSAGNSVEKIVEKIGIEHTACNFGGSRPYLICPGIENVGSCERRVIKIFLGGRYFLCRHCYKLPYASQHEGRNDRLLRYANNIRMNLGGAPGALSPFPSKPKGMWRKIYYRLHSSVIDAEWRYAKFKLEQIDGAFDQQDLED